MTTTEPEPKPTTSFLDKIADQKDVAVQPVVEVPAPVVVSEPLPPAAIFPNTDIRTRLNAVPPTDDGYFSLLVHADSGVGKTHLVGTASEIGPIIIFDCEGGVTPLRGWNNVYVKRVRNMAELTKGHDELKKYNQGWFKFAGLDSLSEIQDVDMRMVMKEAKEKSKNPEEFNLDVPSPREWGIGRNHVRIVARGFRDLGINLIVTTLTNTIQKEGKPDRYVPNLPGKLQHEIPGFMGIVGWYHFGDTAQTQRLMQLKGSNRVMAKTRYKELGDLLTNPTIPDIYNAIYNKEPNTNA